MENKDLKKRIIELSYKHKLSHIGSCISAVDIIDNIYFHKKSWEPFVLSSGHAGLALYVVLEKYEKQDAEALLLKHGVHPNRDLKDGIWVSSGSLGHGLGIAIGLALSRKDRYVHCLISDGEMAEGSIYEGLNIAKDNALNHLKLYVNCNGYGAYRRVYDYRIADIASLYPTIDICIRKTTFEYPFLKGQDAHYMVMNDEDYKLALSESQ